MNAISQGAKVMTKIMEIGHWVATGLMAAMGLLALVAPQWLKLVTDVEGLIEQREVSAYGFEVTVVNAAGQIQRLPLALFALGAVVLFVLMALIFRSLNAIIKTAEKTTPFHADNIRRLKRIGIFSIAVPLVGLLMSVVIRLAAGPEAVEVQMDQSGVIMGAIVLCLTQYFVHGAQLEQDVDGLL